MLLRSGHRGRPSAAHLHADYCVWHGSTKHHTVSFMLFPVTGPDPKARLDRMLRQSRTELLLFAVEGPVSGQFCVTLTVPPDGKDSGPGVRHEPAQFMAVGTRH